MMTIRRAVPADTQTVVAILRSVAGWLHERGYDQWPDGSPSLAMPRIGAAVRRGEFWLASDGDDPVACIAITDDGDTDFWTPRELAEPAAYISKAAVLRRYAGEGTGALLLRWACDRAASDGAVWVRLDVWKTNRELQAYYRRQGWDYLRTAVAAGRNSGALFQRPAEPDPEAQAAVTLTYGPADYPPTPGRGSAVIVATPGGPRAGVVTDVSADWSMGVTARGWETGEGGPPPVYTVDCGGETFTGGVSQVWADPGAVDAKVLAVPRRTQPPLRRAAG